jgi:hypothetical protein
MFRCFRFAAAGLMVACSLPLLTVSLLIAGVLAAGIAVLSRFEVPRQTADADLRSLWSTDEFRFEHAIQAYEDLIDVCARRPS